MAFHISNLGIAQQPVARFADEDGNVPEPGDRVEDFNFAHADYDEEDWEVFVDEANIVTSEAYAELAYELR